MRASPCACCAGFTWGAIPALQIRFSTKSFGRDAAHVAATAIENCKGSLVDADISDIIAGRPVRVRGADVAWEVLQGECCRRT